MKSTSSCPKWDGKVSSAGRYLAKFESTVKIYEQSDALDKTVMVDLPTKSEYDALVASAATDDASKRLMRLFKANKRVCAMFTLG